MDSLLKFFLLSASIAFGIYWGTHPKEVHQLLVRIFYTLYTPVFIFLIIIVFITLYIILPERFQGLLGMFAIFALVGIVNQLPIYEKYRKTNFHTVLKKYTSDIKFTPKVVLFICFAVFGIPIILGLLIGLVDQFLR